jgi:hypothetical protein
MVVICAVLHTATSGLASKCDEAAMCERVIRCEQRAVGVEQHIDATILEVTDHPRQVFDHHRLADAMEDRARQTRQLIDDRGEQLPAHIGGRFERLESARTGFAQQIAAIGDLEVDADRRRLGNARSLLADGLEIAARDDRFSERQRFSSGQFYAAVSSSGIRHRARQSAVSRAL